MNNITIYNGTIPNQATQDNVTFGNAVGRYLEYVGNIFIHELNNTIDDINDVVENIEIASNVCSTALEVVNFKGEWDTNSTYYPYAVGVTVLYNNEKYLSLKDNNTDTPTNTNSWELQKKEAKQITLITPKTDFTNLASIIYDSLSEYDEVIVNIVVLINGSGREIVKPAVNDLTSGYDTEIFVPEYYFLKKTNQSYFKVDLYSNATTDGYSYLTLKFTKNGEYEAKISFPNSSDHGYMERAYGKVDISTLNKIKIDFTNATNEGWYSIKGVKYV